MFSYFEIDIFAQPEHWALEKLAGDNGEMDTDKILPIFLGSWPMSLQKDNLLWVRLAPLYRPPDVQYSGFWIYFSLPDNFDFPVRIDEIHAIKSAWFEGQRPLHLEILNTAEK